MEAAESSVSIGAKKVAAKHVRGVLDQPGHDRVVNLDRGLQPRLQGMSQCSELELKLLDGSLSQTVGGALTHVRMFRNSEGDI